MQTIKYLVSVGGLEVNALNREGITPLDVLIRSRRDVRDSEIEKSLKNVRGFGTLENDHRPAKNNSWESLMKQHIDWFDQQKSALMVVASLIATMAFQVGVNPPGGVWQDDKPDNSGRHRVAGDSVFAYKLPRGYTNFYIVNMIAFIASLSIILLLMSGLPLRRRVFLWILMVITWIAITTIALCYLVAVVALTPDERVTSILPMMGYMIILWIALMALLLIGHTIRMIVKLVKKLRKAWTRRRSSASSAVPAAGP